MIDACVIHSIINFYTMKKFQTIMWPLLVVAVISCAKEENAPASAEPELKAKPVQERVVVANRGSASISIIDAASNTLIGTTSMPDNGEPMYVVHVPQAKAVFVGDRANDRVVAFDEDDHSVIGTVPAGEGVFHMWASPNGRQLWVNNDVDNTTTVISTASMQVKGTAQTPADLVAQGGKPHDVFVDPDKKSAYVSVLGVAGSRDYVVRYNTNKYQETGRVAVGKDPHLFADDVNDLLYVPCQGSDSIFIIDRSSFTLVDKVALDNAHGIFMPQSGQYVYVADIAGSRLATFDSGSNSMVGAPVPAAFPTAHNLSVNDGEDKLFVTHSGATADQLSIYNLNPTPSFSTSITVGTNPFGLAYYTY